MSTIRMSVYTFMGLIDKDIPLAKVTDKESGRVFEYAWIKINLAEITLDGRVDAQQNIAPALQITLRTPTANMSEEFRVNADIFVIREVSKDAQPQSWAVRLNTMSKAQQRKLIHASELTDAQKGSIIPRFIAEIGVVKDANGGMTRGIAVRPAGRLSASISSKRKGKSAKAALRR